MKKPKKGKKVKKVKKAARGRQKKATAAPLDKRQQMMEYIRLTKEHAEAEAERFWLLSQIEVPMFGRDDF